MAEPVPAWTAARDGTGVARSVQRPTRALVVGHSGGIGTALVYELASRGLAREIVGWSRRPWSGGGDQISGEALIDYGAEASIQRAADSLGEVDLVIVATGMLHGGPDRPSNLASLPEKSLSAVDPDAMASSFLVNAIGPALVAKHVLPRLPRSRRAVLAFLSARVGSISDNQLGGWHSYRASKAALNQVVRTISIELAVRRPDAIAVALHPGTVNTALSRPFQSGLPTGQLTDAATAARHLLDVIGGLGPEHSGGFLDWAGRPIAF